MITELLTKHNIKPTGLIQAGVHYWQELPMWLSMGIKDFVAIEPLTDPFRIAQKAAVNIPADVIFYNVAIGEKNESVMMFVDSTNQMQSSSVLKPKDHLKLHPRVQFTLCQRVEVKRLDDLQFDRAKYNLLFLDIQGYELPAFKGAVKTLKHIDFIYTEISFVELYQGCTLLPELDSWMDKHGFKRVWLGDDRGGYSDCAFVKK